jgi:hypothetical protein
MHRASSAHAELVLVDEKIRMRGEDEGKGTLEDRGR